MKFTPKPVNHCAVPWSRRRVLRLAAAAWMAGLSAGWQPAVCRAQAVGMGADGAIHLDQFSQADPGAPVVIDQAPQVFPQSVVPQWGAPGQPMMCAPNAMCAPQCYACTPAYVPVAQQAPLGMTLWDGYGSADWQILAGGEFIFARANFSDAPAYASVNVPTNTVNFVQMDFDYEPSFSAFAGVLLRGWGGSVIFDFTRLESESEFGAVSDAANVIVTPLPLGLNVNGTADVKIDSYDLSLNKSLFFGGPYTASNGQRAWQPRYELAFSGAIRYADVEWSRQINSFTPATGALFNTTTTQLDFQGIGPRVGLTGRRYIGQNGFASVYAKGDWSLLFGDVDISTTSVPFRGLYSSSTSVHQVIPVTEIELGASVHVGRYATLSAGYFWAAWHDLGMRDEFPLPAAFPTSHYDDANILGFDGLFARAEVTF